ncbi:hypothetical protein AVEN_240517-1 [Araneus ventricosus]|uniref:Uncharacterized protein n=1 Tax=Araneus ventricosus TaxID=182803 RepID=A0A4Y2GXY8_ARAVE|nr:hypothetical protein AVEN_240517-1 [Araneus ventricosus]
MKKFRQRSTTAEVHNSRSSQQAEVYSRQKRRSRSRQKTKEFQEAFSVQISASESPVCDAQPITAERRNICNLKCLINCKKKAAVYVKT